VKYFVEPWNPSFGSPQEFEDAAGPTSDSSAELKLDIELPTAAWRPLPPRPEAAAPATVLLVDGVRRVDAYLWVEDDDGGLHPAVAISYAAGVVRCDLRRGAAAVTHARLERGLFTPAVGAAALGEPPAGYRAQTAKGAQHDDLVRAGQRAMLALEAAVSDAARLSQVDSDDLLITDGPLGNRHRLPRALGYVKTHRTTYLPERLSRVVIACRPGERSPVFYTGPRWPHYSWYLRLPGPAGSPWAGVVRVQASPDLTVEQAIALADRSAVTLPRFASRAYKDPRAPQNLIPIAGLERRLRNLLGDPRLLHRSLTKAAR
jgi:hypothetical protein